MESKIKTFDVWLSENFGKNAENFDSDVLRIMRYTYDCSSAETLKYVMSNVIQTKESE